MHRGKAFRSQKEEESAAAENTEKSLLNLDETEVIDEAEANAEDNAKMHFEESNAIADTYGSEQATETESEKSNASETEDMEKYLPSHGVKPGEYDDFLAKHIKVSCSVCQQSCKDFSSLRQHFTDVHKRVGYVLCCGTKHKTRSFLVDHIHIHLNPDYFKCEECSKVFKERRGLMTHIAWHKGKIYRCTICRRKFLDKTKYKMHKKTHVAHKKQQFPCPECGKT